jgi:DNA-binding response OmpR family regulator
MKILIIEDEQELSNDIKKYLSIDNYICEQVYNFETALEKIMLYSYDCILLDLSIPGGDGLDILKIIQDMNIESGIIVTSARNTVDDKIIGIKDGADDYLAKPYSLSELGIRIYALVRRQKFHNNNILRSNNLKIDLLLKTVTIDNREINLTKTEYDLLLFLIGNKNKVVSKDAIAEYLSGDMADMLDNHNFVYAHIKNLKLKLSRVSGKLYIKTIYKIGYKWIQ